MSKKNNTTDFLSWVKSLDFKWVLVVVITLAIIIAILANKNSDQSTDSNNQDNVNATQQSAPTKFAGDISTSSWNEVSFTRNPDLSFKAPQNWDKTSNTDDPEVESIRYRSPSDSNGFYYCVDIKEFPESSNKDLSMRAIVISANPDFTASGIGKPLNLISYRPFDNNQIHTTVIDDTTIHPGDNVEFNESITNPLGRRLQWVGQYNCESPVDIQFDNYMNGDFYYKSFQMASKLSY